MKQPTGKKETPTVYFVGMHNKPGMKPLDSKTLSGKMIDCIIDSIHIPCVKTNLCEVDYMPINRQEILNHNIEWSRKYDPSVNDIIVLLGNWVHVNFKVNHPCIVKLPHPASRLGIKNKAGYIKNAIDKIYSIPL